MRKSIPALSLAALVASAVLFLGARGHETAPKALGELPLTQSFRFPIAATRTFSQTMPSNVGLAITEVYLAMPQTDTDVTILVDGVTMLSLRLGNFTGQTAFAQPSPPILVPPGGTVTIGTSSARPLLVSGYYLTLADIGL